MHDIAIIQGILDAVIEKAATAGWSGHCLRNLRLLDRAACGKSLEVKEITLEIEIGALKFVEPENARFWLREMLKKEFGPKLKAKISIKTIEPEIKCRCGFQGKVKKIQASHDMAHAGIFEMHCPKCNGTSHEITGGQEVLIREMEFK